MKLRENKEKYMKLTCAKFNSSNLELENIPTFELKFRENLNSLNFEKL